MAQDNAPLNRLLLALPAIDYRTVRNKLERVTLEQKQVLFDVATPIEYIYFPESCVVSIVAAMSTKTAVETATIGNEGMVGLPVLLGTDRTNSQAFVQVPGEAFRMTTEDFRALIGSMPNWVDVLHRFTQALFTMVAQTSACNRLHMMSERCARWLLHCHDRLHGRQFPLTHQFLSQMLGVRRATVTEAMRILQHHGVTYANGLVTIKDRRALEEVACECYAIVTDEFNRLLGEPAAAPENPLLNIQTSEGGFTTLTDGAEGPDEDTDEAS